jgi:hypothetical protein
MTVAELAIHIREAASPQLRWRLVREFLEEFKHEAGQSRQALLTEPPPPTADVRWDALLGAIAEHLAFHDALPGVGAGRESLPVISLVLE